MQNISYFNVCKNLIAADLIIFKQTFIDKFIDLSIWVALNILVMSYVMPYFGLVTDFGVFQLGGLVAAAGFFELYANTVELITDFEGDRIISFNLTLPIPSWLAIVSKAVYYLIIYCILTVLMIPLGKLCLGSQFDLRTVNYPKLILAIITLNIFYACFVLWVASKINNMTKMGNIWCRYIFPIWFLGGFHFSWMALYKNLTWLALISLANPMIYITEAVRVALLGQDEFINFWLCILMILLFAVASLYLGITSLKKRLDFVGQHK